MPADPLFILVVIAVIAVVIILVLGLGGFASGGEFNKRNSNKLMRLRLIAQFIAVILIVIYVYVKKGTG
ncbi:MAG TPA: twin transmembrane helix small protein [Roseobacter sp.]|uniref:HIG1 domain-containing protein n=1 Tax=marine sediment metagenome TaxID=412755 RepID=A0A0F9IVV8_9ZZZZ|nr:twin transmembrane helix small protein [Roseobacter sp.]|tara:strand:+ start:3591 stop:3797 length:207 start_codon:yes stop_codon:yes gene_type:complete